MIEFKEIGIDDKEIIQRFTLNSPHRSCNLSFSNLYSWRFLYGTRYAVVDNFLLLRLYLDDELVYFMPIGQGDLSAVLAKMIDDADRLERPFRLSHVCQLMREDIEQAMSGMFEFSDNRDYADYIYLREELATLRGKKLQPKRNHINKFKRTYPNYEYLPITKELIPECMELEVKWCKANDCSEQAGLLAEREAMANAFGRFDELGLTGGVLRVEGQTVAFTFGMPINADTFDVMIEKADTTIDGAYPMINNLFANHIPERYTYINREEDLGLEGLRKAKLSYQPHLLLAKCMATLKENIAHERAAEIFVENLL